VEIHDTTFQSNTAPYVSSYRLFSSRTFLKILYSNSRRANYNLQVSAFVSKQHTAMFVSHMQLYSSPSEFKTFICTSLVCIAYAVHSPRAYLILCPSLAFILLGIWHYTPCSARYTFPVSSRLPLSFAFVCLVPPFVSCALMPHSSYDNPHLLLVNLVVQRLVRNSKRPLNSAPPFADSSTVVHLLLQLLASLQSFVFFSASLILFIINPSHVHTPHVLSQL
jgi:hypothetical protein